MSSVSRDITPPPLKRIRLDPSAEKRQAHPETAIAIFSWNVNGIAPFIQRPITSFFKQNTNKTSNSKSGVGIGNEAHTASLRDLLRQHAWPTVLFLQEVKINPDDSATIAAVEKAVRRQHHEDTGSPSYRAHLCLPSDKHNARGFGRKLYGVCSIIREDFYQNYVDHVRPVSWDQEGRFLVIETKATSELPKLAIFNVYAVNGTENLYRDSGTGKPSGTRHDRKVRVHALLQAECSRLENKGFECIIVGDINIARSAIDGHPNLRTFPKQHCINRTDFEARFISDTKEAETKEESNPCLNMVDTFRHLHPNKRGYTYYPRTKTFGESCDRVDMILISKGLETYLKEAGMYETAGDRGPSDHVPLYARLNFRKSPEEEENEEVSRKKPAILGSRSAEKSSQVRTLDI